MMSDGAAHSVQGYPQEIDGGVMLTGTVIPSGAPMACPQDLNRWWAEREGSEWLYWAEHEGAW